MFHCPRPNSKNAISSLDKKIQYNPEYFGISNDSVNGDGSGIRICVIDTGYPVHNKIPVSLENVIDFSNNKNGARDDHGHATGVAGILKGNGDVKGIAPAADMFYAKAIANSGQGTHSAVHASILYAIVKNVDIIVMSFGCNVEHPLLNDVINKAYKSGICLFAATGNINSKKKDIIYPANFSEVMGVGYTKGNERKEILDARPGVALPYKSLDTMYKHNDYIKMSGNSILTPVVAGMAARIIQKYDRKMTPKQVYSALTTICCY